MYFSAFGTAFQAILAIFLQKTRARSPPSRFSNIFRSPTFQTTRNSFKNVVYKNVFLLCLSPVPRSPLLSFLFKRRSLGSNACETTLCERRFSRWSLRFRLLPAFATENERERRQRSCQTSNLFEQRFYTQFVLPFFERWRKSSDVLTSPRLATLKAVSVSRATPGKRNSDTRSRSSEPGATRRRRTVATLRKKQTEKVMVRTWRQ